ncbi:8119_t:CDS:2 [Ambispora leptoticha]|uniref:RING-type E3 ubiquitin transferase (cysteine targeting) n=1 Tax=Ambispora leptoticha TaxID=144679 RepID=A0A9N9H6X1_9GLOM|nr:8119_t:CDS:2 [Ambispora leptoticha]
MAAETNIGNMSKNFWSNEWLKAQTKLGEIRQSLATFPSPPLRIMRVSQLDADSLDNELFGLLKEQLLTAFGLFSAKTFEPELLALLQLVLYRFSIYESGATYGAQLQNLKYRNEKRHVVQSTSADDPLSKFQRISYGAMTIGGQYVWMRLNRLMTAQGWGEFAENDIRRVFWKFMQKIENIYRTLSLANFLIFLYDGKYRSLIDRILFMRLVYARRTTNRQVSFEFLNRQLVWHAFTEFLLFLMPLINLRKLKNIMKRMLLPTSYTKSNTLNFLPAQICAICYENQTSSSSSSSHSSANASKLNNPYETNCGHKYCYYCIKSKLILEDGTWQCLRCGEEVKSIQRAIEIGNYDDGFNANHVDDNAEGSENK